ncbi:pH-response regulator protein palF/RIM8 [Nannizzia gypsea CBS 118893]|uniref:pH-response regulator protein palF/RIM8 n=1 Tax=Arthroderma gypseum (strain ATCC MYA-4604 / CBS 118893) TaxID=535722 RepID=E4UQN5_ARTGP|nr:pH-response regulator protein palF/RIM8 [Nannizzia gypsea CBS 118893]EFR00053.1 pH-response regulator protein palF/RIM8 [Nannizzia gypsea CBS 118893]
MALETNAIDSSTVPPTRHRSILSKLTSRFGNRNRNISEFYVQPDDPWKSYHPGEIVKGAVVLTVVKPVRITHLVVCLHGYAKVFKNTVGPGEHSEESGYLGPGRGRRDGEYLGNGFTSLFEDEVVLCGDGRLKEGIYKFRFELCFPPYSLPSSINFERGTISYMITSTLTRPTTITPSISCDKRLILIERIDIAPLPAPKARVITLEPVSARSKSKSRKKSTSERGFNGSAGPASLEPSSSQTSEPKPPLSPVPSEQSTSSYLSNSTQSFQIISESNTTRDSSTITATTKLLRGGGLPGDILPLRIMVNHTKPIRSPHGIIVTLYRQGRIDMYPAIPIGTPAKGKRPVYEDYYPKSRTGLGGLSFGATRTCSVFRKDMSQIFCPLIVDPNNMTADIKTSIRIPEDCFPTITRVPGAMISFRYYVEVVMDIRGKLAGQDRFLPRLNIMNSSSNNTNYCAAPRGFNTVETSRGGTSTTSSCTGNILDTDQVRRDKSVIVCVFEVIVGSKDSGRGQQQQQKASSDGSVRQDYPTSNTDQPTQPTTPETVREQQQQGQTPQIRFADRSQGGRSLDNGHGAGSESQEPWHARPPDQYVIDPPLAQPEEEVDEKTRLRRAEAMLLPSAPPASDEAGPSNPTLAPASAPALSEHHDLSYFETPTPTYSASVYMHTQPSAPSPDTITPYAAHEHSSSIQHAGAYPYSSESAAESSTHPTSLPSDDKQELEKQRLLNERSAPPGSEAPESAASGPSQASAPASENGDIRHQPLPSAPVLTEDDIIGQPIATGESLPRYQR